MNIINKLKKFTSDHIIFFIILFLSLTYIWPSFSLHFDGDSYFTLWRYQQYFVNRDSFFDIGYFLTDYGPQDTIFASLHKFFGLMPVYFYLSSFMFRLIAAFSFYPLIFYLTRNKPASSAASVFFAISATGLETTNWVFNMPSYISIVFLNLFLLNFLKITNGFDLKHLIFSGIFFLLAIIFQPIRMSFLPFLIIAFGGYLFLFAKNIVRKNVFFSIVFYIFLFLFLFIFGKIGDSIGVRGTPEERIKGVWIQKTSENMLGLSRVFRERDYTKLLYPIGQIGNIAFPNSFLKSKNVQRSENQTLLKVVLPIFLIFMIAVLVLERKIIERQSKLLIVVLILLGFSWSLSAWWLFIRSPNYPLSTTELAGMLIGGYLILTVSQFLALTKNVPTNRGIILGMAIILLSFAIPWTRFPHIIHETIGRYLIVSAAGFSILVGSIIAKVKNYRVLILFLIPLFLIHFKEGQRYLKDLKNDRDYKLTEKIRSSFPKIEAFSEKNKYPIVYFQTNNEKVLYHSLMFGFPVIMYFYQEANYIWNIAYTESWQEVVDAYLTGEGFRRFGTIPIQPAEIQDIYSFKLDGDTLIDTTTETREKLMSIER